MEVARLPQPFQPHAGLQFPIGQERSSESLDRRATDAGHGVDPLADARVLLEEAGIDEVHAAGVGDPELEAMFDDCLNNLG